jgi:hypothetical protein
MYSHKNLCFASVGRILLLCALFFCLVPQLGASGRDFFAYQIQFPPTPLDYSNASATVGARAKGVLAALACGSEVDFAGASSFDAAGMHTIAVEDTTAILIAKLEWAMGHPDEHGDPTFTTGGGMQRELEVCRFTRYFLPQPACRVLNSPIDPVTKLPINCDDLDVTNPAAVLNIVSTAVESVHIMFGRLNTDCWNSSATLVPAGTPSPYATPPFAASLPDAFRIDFLVTPGCMVAQINAALERMEVNGQMGSDKLPCDLYLGGTVHGDWDVSVRNLTRLAYLSVRFLNPNTRNLIHPAAYKQLTEQLLTAAGPPAEESYPVTGCGNSEQSTGSAQERADERDWTDAPFWRTIGDILGFLLKLLAVVVVAYLAVVLLVTVLGPAITGLAVIAGGVAVIIAVTNNFPETENHLLMINTSTYLKNQMILTDPGVAPSSSGADRFRKDQSDLKEWLLSKMHYVMQHDFIEYNSRPYNRYSIFALQNIADFANDDDLRTGARIVLDYMGAKFAAGSHQGRRFLPFRRRRDAMAQYIDVDATKDGHSDPNGLFDLLNAGDHEIGLGLIYGGQTDQLWANFVSFGTAAQAIYAATSFYRPEDLVVDLAILKDDPIYQRIHHTSGEVYSSGRSFLISAGGITSDYAYTFSGIGQNDDLGVAMPTTLFLRKETVDDAQGPPGVGVGRTTLNELIRIDGQRVKSGPTYDQNLCVWDGFACGVNIVIPPVPPGDMTAGFSPVNQLGGTGGPCLSKGPPGTATEWGFIDSSRCPAYRSAPRFFIAIYRQNCPLLSATCQDNFGFFEIVDAGPMDDFESFKTKVTAANKPGFIAAPTAALNGTYHSFRGQVIEFQTAATSRNAGITAVNGIFQSDFYGWALAEGNAALPPNVKTPILSNGTGYVSVSNPRFPQKLELDFSNYQHPVRTVK